MKLYRIKLSDSAFHSGKADAVDPALKKAFESLKSTLSALEHDKDVSGDDDALAGRFEAYLTVGTLQREIERGKADKAFIDKYSRMALSALEKSGIAKSKWLKPFVEYTVQLAKFTGQK